jgi:hypothetical protein
MRQVLCDGGDVDLYLTATVFSGFNGDKGGFLCEDDWILSVKEMKDSTQTVLFPLPIADTEDNVRVGPFALYLPQAIF